MTRAGLWVPHAITRPSSLALSMAFADFFSPEKKKRLIAVYAIALLR